MPNGPSLPPRISPEELGHPSVARGTALATVAFFALVLGAIPLHQALGEWRTSTPVGAMSLLRDPPRWSDFDFGGATNPLQAFERALVDSSVARKSVQPRVQEVLTGALSFGNRSVVVGHEGWLYYRPGVDYLGGPGFLAPSFSDTGGGPLPAIARFQADCRAAGVRLILMLVPEKGQIYPEHLGSGRVGTPPQNADDAAFRAALGELGVEVFDTTETIKGVAQRTSAFLRQETHWSPEAMDAVAAALATHLRPTGPYAPVRAWQRTQHEVRRLGDLVYNLQLPPGQAVFTPESAMTEPILAADGGLWVGDSDAEVVLLGDSFTNVYAQADMGWGEGAGLGAHLALHLSAGVDTIAVNAGGASDARRQLASRTDPLGGKKVVVWEFVVRDLAERNWEVIPIRSTPRPAVAQSDALVIEAELLNRPSLPPPSTLYANARVFLKYRVKRVISGTFSGSEVLVQMPVLKDRAPLPSLRYRVGAVQDLTLTAKVPDAWEGQPVVDETREYDLQPLWALRVEPAPP